ncbi:MAG: hypothetical protein KAJ07_00525 [Planctomycetes bacterium]|nr:hypothetical protein [Planctomycetota bacterium]
MTIEPYPQHPIVDNDAGEVSVPWQRYFQQVSNNVVTGAVGSVFGRTGSVVAVTGDYTWAQINKSTSSIADITTRSHALLTDVGSNTHAQIDSHISDATLHFAVGSIDHGSIAGLGDDDHPHYFLADGTRALSGALQLSGDISPSQITANQDDYNPTGLSTSSTLRLSTDASRDITGLAGGADGRILLIHNIGSNDIVLKDEDASSTAGNRFALNADVTVLADNLVILQYDSTSARWRVVAGGGGAGGGGAVEIVTPTLTNKSGASTVVGYVYRLDPDNDDSFDYGSEDEDAPVIVANSVITNNSSGEVVISGYEDVYVTGDTNRGDYLYFSATNGQAKPSTIRKDGAFAIATASRSGAGVVKAFIFEQDSIRKWSWTDEPTWRGSVPLPILGGENIPKISALNPIIERGVSGNWDDTIIQVSTVVISDNEVKVYYLGYDGTNFAIGLAQCPLKDIVTGPYVKNTDIGTGVNAGRIMTSGIAWEGGRVALPVVIYDPEAPDNDTLHTGDYKYKMFYVGSLALSGVGIGYAYSTDGITFTKYASNPIITETLWTPNLAGSTAMTVIKLGRTYYLAYADTARTISVSASEDPTSWVVGDLLGTIVSKGGGGSWDAFDVASPAFYHNSGIIYLSYRGVNTGDTTRKIGLAVITLKDLVTGSVSASKFSFNPILSLSNPGSESWDAGRNWSNIIVQVDNIFYFFFTASDGVSTANRSIGIAYIANDGRTI